MMNGITADTLKREYIPQIVSIEKQSFRQPWSEDAFEHELANAIAHYTVLLKEGKVAAYGGYWHIIDEGHITNIAVRSDLRGQGLGHELMRSIILSAQALNLSRLTLEVRVSNAVATALYTHFGFKSAGKRTHYYPDGEDAYIMWAEVQDAANRK